MGTGSGRTGPEAGGVAGFMDVLKKDERLAANICPNCEKKLDASTCLDKGDPNHKPMPGSISICFYCAAFLVFDAQMRMQTLPGSEVVKLPREQVEMLTKARRAIYARRMK
jgi:hypothetical protein